MDFDCKILSQDEIKEKIEEVLICKRLDINRFIMDSECIYSDVYDFMFKVIEIKIIKKDDKLYTLNLVDDNRWIEPLFIQVSDSGTLLDYFFLDFISNTKEDLSNYYINYIDFSYVMDGVRESENPSLQR